MAKIVGAAGAHAGKQSVAAFKKMFATVLFVVAVIAFAEGVMLTSLVTLHGRLPWYLIPIGIGLLAVWIVRIANFRVEKHETDRMTWRKGLSVNMKWALNWSDCRMITSSSMISTPKSLEISIILLSGRKESLP